MIKEVFAQPKPIGFPQPSGFGVQVGKENVGPLFGTVVRNGIRLAFTIAAIAVLIMFLWGTIDWIFSGGDKEKVASARKKIISAIVGLVLISLTFVILGALGQITSFDLLGDLVIPFLGDK